MTFITQLFNGAGSLSCNSQLAIPKFMTSRRSFLGKSAKVSLMLGSGMLACKPARPDSSQPNSFHPLSQSGLPIVVATWGVNLKATEAAMHILEEGGTALDAVEAGARVPEADPKDTSVGLGGFPDRSGMVTLDACIMDAQGNAGSVTFLPHILHPVSVARKVMEETPHVILSGQGALAFARQQGFEEMDLLTPKAEAKYQAWLNQQEDQTMKIFEGNHDTIGILAIDSKGDIAGACTTSGAAFKMPGRVGDSPIIGGGCL